MKSYINKNTHIVGLFLALVVHFFISACFSDISNDELSSDPMEVEEEEVFLLHTACRGGDFEQVQALIEQGSDVNQIDKDGQTPLFVACEKGHVEIAWLLLLKHAEVNQQIPVVTKQYGSLLNMVCQELVFLDEDEKKKPKYAAIRKKYAEIAKILVHAGVDINRTDQYGNTAFLIACKTGQLDLIELLLQKGADINGRDLPFMSSPLSLACYQGKLETVKLLIDKGADVNQPNRDGKTPLFIAYELDNMRVVKFLVEKGASVNTQVPGLGAVLHNACKYQDIDTIKELLKQQKANIYML